MKNLIRVLLAAVLFVSMLGVIYQPAGSQSVSATQYQVAVDHAAHQKFGLYYPVTYMFQIPTGQSGLTAQFRTSDADPWTTLSTRAAGEIFNGVNAARFDYANNTAYLSVAFSSSSDTITLRILNGENEIPLVYLGVPTYYDNRKAAVTISLDDWDTNSNADFVDAATILSQDNIHFTVGVITTARPNWSLIQTWLNSGYMEVASHSRTHACDESDYAATGYDYQVTGSKQDILANLQLTYPYVQTYIEPCGTTSPAIRQAEVNAGYLAVRGYPVPPVQNTFAAWGTDGAYQRILYSIDTWSWPWYTQDAGMLAQANASFDTAYAADGIYHLVDHPWQGRWFAGSTLDSHSQYISNRSDVWYAAFGDLYLYHYVQERGQITVVPYNGSSSTPLPTLPPTSIAGTSTSTPTATAVSPSATATNTQLPTATNTPLPTATNTPLPTLTSTNTPAATATGTPLPSMTPTLTATSAAGVEYSFWPNSTVPSNANFDDLPRIELGVKFRAAVNGTINGLRFYKGTVNTGQHIAHLWTSSGQLLADAVFVNETASGWQTVRFDIPVAITANTQYVASYYSPEGNYALNSNYFVSGFTSGPLYAYGDAESSGNGVYCYGVSCFPNEQWDAANYWVDVIFQPASSTQPTATATPASSFQYQVVVDSAKHQTYGLYYPVTYMFQIPGGSSGLTAQYRYNQNNPWTSLDTKTSADFFNGVNAVRFDYAHNTAYVSVAFSGTSDIIYIRMIHGQSEVPISYVRIPHYYDNRKAAVTVSIDDWDSQTSVWNTASRILTEARVPFTVAIISGYNPDWSVIQSWYDRGYLEPGGHTRDHPCSDTAYLQAGGFAYQIAGIRDDILANLNLRHPYVPSIILPCGFESPSVRQAIANAHYIADRGASPGLNTFAPWGWDGTYAQALYTYATFGWQGTASAAKRDEANASFDSTYSAGGVYHLVDHPADGFWADGSYLDQHIDHISNRLDVWYAAFGDLYLYHFVDERRLVTVSPLNDPIQTATPTATNTPLPTSTNTPLPTATNTPLPTATNTPLPTATNTPLPTATATPLPELIFQSGYETGNLSEWTSAVTNSGNLSASAASRLVGSYGMQALISSNTAMYVQDSTPASEAIYRASFSFDPNSIPMSSGNAHYIFAARTGTTDIVRWQFRYSGGLYQVQGQVRTNSGTYLSTAWFTITDAPHALNLDWAAATTTSAADGLARWWIDGVLVESQSGLVNGTMRVDDARLGPYSGIDNGTRGTVFFDAFESYRSTTPLPDMIFQSGYETGNLSEWTSAVTNSGTLSASAASRLVGSYGMQALISSNTAMYVQDSTPASETHYRARFYFDPNSIRMSLGNAHYIFAARMGTTQILRWQFRYSGGLYQVQGQVRTDSGAYLSTAWYTISDAPHALELNWVAATTTTAADGVAQWWIDGVLVESQNGLVNGTLHVDDVQLGPLSGIDTGTRGTEFFDAFESHRSTYIGP